MSLSLTIEKAVDAAFSAVYDLAKDAVLYANGVNGFNFSTGQVTSSGASQVAILAIPYQEDNTQESAEQTFHSTINRAIIKSKNLDISLYDEIEIDSITYRIETYEKFPGVYLLELRGP